MKSFLLFLLWLCIMPAIVAQEIDFNRWFEPRTLRVDYLLAGDHRSEVLYFSRMVQEPEWGGPRRNLIDPFGYGSYRYCAYDSATGTLLFTRGFSSLFQEWKGTPEAKGMKRAFPMTAVMPFPRQTIRFVIERRDFSTNQFEPLFERFINPSDYFIYADHPAAVKVTKLLVSGDASNHVDIAFIAEGYTAADMEKFNTDARRIMDYFLSAEPFSLHRDKFNFYALEAPSQEQGVDIPGEGIYAATNINSTFYTFDMDRYLTTSDTRAIYDIAANVPYDAVFVLVNSKRYGGGGFYNHYGQGTVDHNWSKEVAIHEFGHSFAGLADEYYAAEVTYSDFYNLRTEPWEPNITTGVDFPSKWKDMVTPGIPLPTPRESAYDKNIGLFEGGGYLAKGIFSPMMNCRMKSNDAKGFCPVCQRAITRMILFYCD